MAPPNKAKSLAYLRWILLLPIPVFWGVLEHQQALTFIENRSVDWRFQIRGELESPVKLVYVDIDSLSLSKLRNHPWSRDLYSKVAAALVREAKVKAVGIDIVFSDTGISQSAHLTLIDRGNREFEAFLAGTPPKGGTPPLAPPPVVLAACYAGWKFVDVNGRRQERQISIVSRETRLPSQVEEPEIPYFLHVDSNGKRFDTPPAAIGLIDTISNGTRVVPAWAPNKTGIDYFHLAAELARLYWDLAPWPKGLGVRDGNLEFVKSDGSVFRSLPLIDGQLLEINWFTKWHATGKVKSAPSHVEFYDVLRLAVQLESPDPKRVQEAKEFFSDPELKDSVVLIGPVDPLFQDLAPTSLDEDSVPKVGVHGNLLRTIVSGLTLRRPVPWQTQFIIFGLTAISVVLFVAGGRRVILGRVLKVMAVFVVVLYAAATFWCFKQAHWVLPFVAPLGAAFTTSLGGLIIQYIDEQKAKARVQGMFGTYVSPQLVDRMVESGEEPNLGGDDHLITAYFSDIQGFSKFSEKLGSKKLVDLLNEYLTACTDIVQEQEGTLDKYIGDAVVAMYGAPIKLKDHAFRACVTTQLVHQKLGELRAKWKSEGEKWPEIVCNMQTRIGLNTGLCTIGNMGSLGSKKSRARFNYTMMGDNVNLAARMESGAKGWGAYTMVTEDTKKSCEEHGGDRVVFRPLGRIQVMGREQAVPIHEIVGLKESLLPNARECLGIFAQGLEKWYARDWDGAIAFLKQSSVLEPNQPGRNGVKLNPSLALIDHAEEYKLEQLGDDWDGRYVMKEK
jgi:adenylate cyclase